MREIGVLLAVMLALAGCSSDQNAKPATGNQTPGPGYPYVRWGDLIPANATKMFPQTDAHPPILHSDEWEAPVPLGPPINNAGAEDSPFITPDGNTLYVFYTPDVSVPAEKQVLDNVTGIWVSKKQNGKWTEPQRAWLQDPGKLSLDGCEFVQNSTIWFCSAREGYTGLNWFSASYADGKWADWKEADFPGPYEVGELHISANGTEMYYHSLKPGGKGGLDIWVTENRSGQWQEPINVAEINSAGDEGWPYLSQDGNELWFTRFYKGSPAVFRSKKADGIWQEPELIIEQFAGEPTLDEDGNLYFTHHFYEGGTMLEADIYVAYRK